MPQKRTSSTGRDYWMGRVALPGGREISESFRTRREAKEWEDEQRVDIRKGVWVDPRAGKTTVGELVAAWVGRAETPGTRDNRADLLANLGDLEHRPANSVRPKDISEWVETLLVGRPWARGRPLAPLTVEIKRGQLSGVFTNAVQAGALGRSPFTPDALTVRSHQAAQGEDLDDDDQWAVSTVRTLEECTRLADMCEHGHSWTTVVRDGGKDKTVTRYIRGSLAVATMIRLGMGTGARAGEMAGFKLSDLDTYTGILQVRRQAKTSPTGWRKLKTPSSRRDLPLAEETLLEVERYLRSVPTLDAHGAMFRTTRGGMWTAPTLAASIRRLREPAGIPDLVFHDLRHFYATSLIGSGLSVTAVQTLLGHSTPTTTLRVYAHFWPAEQEIARSAISAVLRGRGNHGEGDRSHMRAV